MPPVPFKIIGPQVLTGPSIMDYPTEPTLILGTRNVKKGRELAELIAPPWDAGPRLGRLRIRPLGDVVVLMPPLTITTAEVDRIVDTLDAAIEDGCT